MKFSGWLSCGALALLLGAGLSGCMDSGQSQLEEEKESHFLAGKSCLNGMDYKGAIEEFNKALKLNPDSGSAHFQLGCLYEERDQDPAAAIYHYQEFLKLRPHSDNAEWIRQRITNCKQDLAKSVLLPVTPGVQHQIEELADDKKHLQEELDRWKAAYFAVRATAPTNVSVGTPPRTTTLPVAVTPLPTNPVVTGSNGDRAMVTPTSPRSHTVLSGESPYSIARKYGIKLEALLAANPGLEPTHMRVGQTLNVPAP